MRLVVTGGGTGGHVYPALEVAQEARDAGDELLYLGSIRGQEGKACESLGILFHGFPSEPLLSLRTPAGIKAAAKLLRATLIAKKYLAASKPDVIFSTGGYSSAPVVLAGRSLKIPIALHACDTVPGRAIRMVAKSASAFSCTFQTTQNHVDVPVVRTGHPIRRSLREGLAQTEPQTGSVIVLGGSQGSVYLNQLVARAAQAVPDARILLSTGPKNIDSVKDFASPNLRVVPYLGPAELVDGYKTSSLAIARSGGTIAEFALARLPSILVPLPSSADDHQRFNAKEFEDLGMATLITQPRDGIVTQAAVDQLVDSLQNWLVHREKWDAARSALSSWDVQDATSRIYNLITQARGR